MVPTKFVSKIKTNSWNSEKNDKKYIGMGSNFIYGITVEISNFENVSS